MKVLKEKKTFLVFKCDDTKLTLIIKSFEFDLTGAPPPLTVTLGAVCRGNDRAEFGTTDQITSINLTLQYQRHLCENIYSIKQRPLGHLFKERRRNLERLYLYDEFPIKTNSI
jgi:hypothetical protein